MDWKQTLTTFDVNPYVCVLDASYVVYKCVLMHEVSYGSK